MTAREKLDAAAKLRIPRPGDGQTAREQVDALDSYMLESAWHQGELEEARLEVRGVYFELQQEWDHLVGWEPFKRSKTETAVEDAKRQLKPKLYDGIQQARWLIARLTEQIDRLERDATKCSRSYTLKTGSS